MRTNTFFYKMFISSLLLAGTYITSFAQQIPAKNAKESFQAGPLCQGPETDSTVIVYVAFGKGEKPQSVTVSVKDGKAFMEGGICLGDLSQLQQDSLSKSIVCNTCTLWENASIPYQIDPDANFSQTTLDNLAAAIDQINTNTNISIIPRTSEVDYINIENGDGCWSYLGRVGGGQALSLKDPGCGSTRTIIHEFFHAAGIWHEQSREDRNDYIIVHLDNVEEGKEHNFNQRIIDGEDVGAYEYNSIMHYWPYAFSANDLPTITLLDSITTDGIGGNIMTSGDIEGINTLYPVITSCNHPDFDALMALYNSTNGPNWTNNTGWVDGAAGTDCDPCGWYGIECDGDERVTLLLLYNNQLSGTIPNELESLTNLTHLYLYNNQLSGTIPAEIGNLDNLQSLSLAENQLNGIIPTELENLGNLTRLWLFNNQLSGSIPSELANLNLERLYLHNNQLEGCFSFELNVFCELGFSTSEFSDGYNFTNNPALPWSGDFERFCNGEEQLDASCDDGNANSLDDQIQDDCNCGILGDLIDISGVIMSPTGILLDSVEVQLLHLDSTYSVISDTLGRYTFTDIPIGDTLIVVPLTKRNENTRLERIASINIIDLIKIIRHILGIELLDSPYKRIAADINDDFTITTVDLIQLQSYIIYKTDAYPANAFYRFIDGAFVFPDPTNPWSTSIPEAIIIENPVNDLEDIDFIGVRIGDVH